MTFDQAVKESNSSKELRTDRLRNKQDPLYSGLINLEAIEESLS